VGIDVGQSACKVTALDAGGAPLAMARRSYPTTRLHDGWAEQDPAAAVAAAQAACREAVARAGRAPAAVAVTAATHTAVLLGEDGRALRPAILLSDRRSAPQARALDRDAGETILARARNGVGPEWTLPQLRWVGEHEPACWSRVHRVAFAKDHVRGRLSGDAVTDRIDAEGSLLLDATTGDWDAELCRLVPLEPRALPAPRGPAEVVGHVRGDRGAAFGLPPGIPVAAGTSDTAAEALAAGAAHDGSGVVKLATAGNVNIVTAAPRPSRRWYTYSHVLPGLHYHAFGTNAAAASRAWLQEILGAANDEGYARLDLEAAAVPPGAGGLLFHPYLAGERAPVFDPTLRGSLLGLDAAHGRGHIARAVLEGVALSLAECLAAAEAAGLVPAELRLIGGGSRSPLWAQIVADALGRPLLRPRLDDASAGAALLAGVAAGVLEDVGAAAALGGAVVGRVEPDPARTALYRRLLEAYRAARAAVAPLNRELREIARAAAGGAQEA